MTPEPFPHPADTALSLLFRKLHPLLEDAAHLQARAAPAVEFERLHRRLQASRAKVVEVLDPLAEGSDDEELAAQLETLASNLTPVGEPLRQALILTQLCLEQAPKDLLGFLPAGVVAAAPWGTRMVQFLARLEDPAFGAESRWREIDPDLGEELEG